MPDHPGGCDPSRTWTEGGATSWSERVRRHPVHALLLIPSEEGLSNTSPAELRGRCSQLKPRPQKKHLMARDVSKLRETFNVVQDEVMHKHSFHDLEPLCEGTVRTHHWEMRELSRWHYSVISDKEPF